MGPNWTTPSGRPALTVARMGMQRHRTRRAVSGLIALALLAVSLFANPAPADAWTGWVEVPGNGYAESAPFAVGNEVFVRGTGDRIYGNRRDGSTWTGWAEVPGNGRTLGAPSAVRLPDGGLYLFVRGTDNYVYGNRRTSSQQWGGWHRIGVDSQIFYSGQTYSAPSAVVKDGSQVEVFIRGTNDRVYSIVNNLAGDLWLYWSELPGNGMTLAGPAAARTPDTGSGNTYLFVEGLDDQIYYTYRPHLGSWTGAWYLLPGGGSTYWGPAAVSDANGNLEIFVKGLDGYIWQFYGDEWRWFDGHQSFASPSAAYTSWGLCVFITGTDHRIYRTCD